MASLVQPQSERRAPTPSPLEGNIIKFPPANLFLNLSPKSRGKGMPYEKLIREQEQIWRQFEVAKKAKAVTKARKLAPHHLTPPQLAPSKTAATVAATTDTIHSQPKDDTDRDTSILFDDLALVREQQLLWEEADAEKQLGSAVAFEAAVPPTKKSSPSPVEKVRQSQEDSVQTLSNGKQVRLKGMKHVYTAIANGTAVITHCPHCSAVMQVDPHSCRAIYCIVCRQISCVEQCLECSPRNGADDERVALSVQRQEVFVARKTGKTGKIKKYVE